MFEAMSPIRNERTCTPVAAHEYDDFIIARSIRRSLLSPMASRDISTQYLVLQTSSIIKQPNLFYTLTVASHFNHRYFFDTLVVQTTSGVQTGISGKLCSIFSCDAALCSNSGHKFHHLIIFFTFLYF